ncbi:MAG: transcriptional repressor [Opitutales bacterium]|nr:transcriptional repressor [Opitutales bacterium]
MADLSPVLDLIKKMTHLGLRSTRPRRTICSVAYGMKGHFNADRLLAEVKKVDPEISLATVYRHLPELVRARILNEVDVGHNDKHYVSTKDLGVRSSQLLCQNCSRVLGFESPDFGEYVNKLLAGTDFDFVSQHFQVVVSCPHENCRYHLPKNGDEEPGADAPCRRKTFSVYDENTGTGD